MENHRKNSFLEYDFLTKILVIGSSGVGKSCMLLFFDQAEFNENHLPTIGIDFRVKNVKIGDFNVKIQIWDTAGQERFKSLARSYYRAADGILLIFDTTNRKSFEDLQMWMDQIRAHAPPDVAMILVGNKADLNTVEVKDAEAKNFAKSLGVEYVETSAKTGQNVSAAFLHCVHLILDKNSYIFRSKNILPKFSPNLFNIWPNTYTTHPPTSTHTPPSSFNLYEPTHFSPKVVEPQQVDMRRIIRLANERELRRQREEEEDDCCGF